MTAKLLPFSSDPRRAGRLAEMADGHLVAACAAGDRDAMGELFDRHGAAIHRFLRRLGGSRADVEDMVSATYLHAFSAAKQFRGGAQVRTWLFGIAMNVSRHQRRSEGRLRSFLKLWAEHPRDERSRPDQVVERQQLVARLEQALDKLPYDLRAAYLLCDVEQQSGADAADVLGVPPGTLGRRVHEARKALRAALERGNS